MAAIYLIARGPPKHRNGRERRPWLSFSGGGRSLCLLLIRMRAADQGVAGRCPRFAYESSGGWTQGGDRRRRSARVTASATLVDLLAPDPALLYHALVDLLFVGAKVVAQGFGVQVPIVTSLLVILVAIVASTAVSFGATRGGKSGEGSRRRS